MKKKVLLFHHVKITSPSRWFNDLKASYSTTIEVFVRDASINNSKRSLTIEVNHFINRVKLLRCWLNE